jgi:hypothetical protein
VRAVVVDESLKIGQQGHALPISLQRLCSITRRTRLMRSQGCQRLVYTYSLTAIFAARMAAFPFSSDNADTLTVVFTQLIPDCTLTK